MTTDHDVAVIGGGAAGVAAAVASAQTGARTILVERDHFLGGDLVSGLPILGCCNCGGEWIVGGVLDEVLQRCRELGGYEGRIFDGRTLWGVCVDPDVMRLAVVDSLQRHGVELLLGGTVCGARTDGGRVTGLLVSGNACDEPIDARFAIDCTGDAAVAFRAGAECEKGGSDGELQPVSLIFQMGPVDARAFLAFILDHPEEAILADNPAIERCAAECARDLYEVGAPYVALGAEGSVLGGAIEAGEMYPCTAIFISPTSSGRGEVTLNSTRLPGVDATDSRQLSNALPILVEQVEACVEFARGRLPGFANAVLTRLAPRVGVRETRRIVGDHVLAAEEVIEAHRCADVIARGGHHVDIHGAGTYQKRIPVQGGGSYDIPWGCLIPRGLENVLVAGRCLSSSREANGSARVMGTCLATGQAAGTAAALCAARDLTNVRELPVGVLQEALRDDGAVLEGPK